MTQKHGVACIFAAVAVAALGGLALSAQDKYALRVPEGLPFSDFKGYEDWQLVSMAQTDDRLKAILGNPVAIAAYKSGVPGNGKPFPNGAKLAKVQWHPKKSSDAPFSVNVPDTLADIFLMEKDSLRFKEGGGWGYAQFDYDSTARTFSPNKGGTPTCGVTCHTAVKAKDYVFHPYQMR